MLYLLLYLFTYNKTLRFFTFIPNCVKMLLQITAALLQITTKNYYNLHQKFIANYGSLNFPQIIDGYYH